MSSISLPVIADEASLAGYLDKINKFPYLTAGEEYMLAKRWEEHGDIDAAHQLVTSHLRLVAKIATGFRGYGVPLIELISEGNIGLMHAIKKFDPEKGYRLSTYAMWWIKAAMQEYVLHSWSLVKIGTTTAQKRLFFNLRKAKNRLHKLDNSALTPEEIREISHELDVSEGDVVSMDQRLSHSDKSLNDPFSETEDESSEMIDYIQEGDANQETMFAQSEELENRRALFAMAMKKLNEREQYIITARKLLEKPETLEELSEKFDISRERVRQIESSAFKKLQQAVVENNS